MSIRLRFIALVASLSLAACGTLDEGGAQPHRLKVDTPRVPALLESMIAYHGQAWGLNGAEWAKESARLRAAARGADETLCVRQSLLATAPAAPAHERAQAAGLLEQCERELKRRESRLTALVTLLRAEFAERGRIEERQREATRRADELADKLNELREIEKTLLERSQPASRPKSP